MTNFQHIKQFDILLKDFLNSNTVNFRTKIGFSMLFGNFTSGKSES